MIKTSKIALLLQSIAVLLLSAGIANACWCAIRPPCEMFGSADAVFIGKVTKVEERSKKDGGEGFYPGDFTFHLQVEISFLGAQTESVEVRSGGNDCAIVLREGESYLVYAFNKQGKLWTSTCSRTKKVADATEDLAFLYGLPREGSGARIDGSVSGYIYDSNRNEYHSAGLSGIPVIISGDNFRRKIYTSSPWGDFELTGLKTGKYEIRVLLPDYYSKDANEFKDGVQKIEVNDRGCVRSSYFANVKNSLQGTVLDVMGRPQEGVEVTLVPANKELRKDGDAFYKTDTAKDGKYSLDHIAPGKYLLGISVEEDDGEDNDGFFYPGIASRLMATIIEFGFGRDLVDYNFRVMQSEIEEK